jgi:hypothetical protein
MTNQTQILAASDYSDATNNVSVIMTDPYEMLHSYFERVLNPSIRFTKDLMRADDSEQMSRFVR